MTRAPLPQHHLPLRMVEGRDGFVPRSLDTPRGDVVKSPTHYTYIKEALGVEVIDILNAAFGKDPMKWNAGKYLFRAEHKGNEAQDLRKAKQYIDFRLKQIEDGK